MYPPRNESDELRLERNQRQGVWVISIVWVAIGLFTILAHHNFLSGSGQIGVGVATAINQILEKKAVPRNWRFAVKFLEAATLLAIFVLDWLFRK